MYAIAVVVNAVAAVVAVVVVVVVVVKTIAVFVVTASSAKHDLAFASYSAPVHPSTLSKTGEFKT